MTVIYDVIENGFETGNQVRINISDGFYPGSLFQTLVKMGYDTPSAMDSVYLRRTPNTIYEIK